MAPVAPMAVTVTTDLRGRFDALEPLADFARGLGSTGWRRRRAATYRVCDDWPPGAAPGHVARRHCAPGDERRLEGCARRGGCCVGRRTGAGRRASSACTVSALELNGVSSAILLAGALEPCEPEPADMDPIDFYVGSDVATRRDDSVVAVASLALHPHLVAMHVHHAPAETTRATRVVLTGALLALLAAPPYHPVRLVLPLAPVTQVLE